MASGAPLPEFDDEPSVRHPRGRIWPPLPRSAPLYKRFARGVVRLGQGLHFHEALRHSRAMGFHFFLSLLPALVFVGFIVGAIARRRGVNAIMAPLIDNLPATTETLVKAQLGRLAGANANRLGPLALLGFLWVASGGIHGLMDAVESVVGAPKRKWWKQRLIALGWVGGTVAAVGLASFGIIQWDDVVHAGDGVPVAVSTSAAASASATWVSPDPERKIDATPEPKNDQEKSSSSPRPQRRSRVKILRSEGERVLALILSLAGAVGGLAGFYRISVSHSRRVKRRVLPGAVLAVLLWIVVTWAFGFYVRTLASYAVFYGSLAAVAVLLIWLWLVSLSILVGAELNSQLEGLRDRRE